jgi:hypothetical protein
MDSEFGAIDYTRTVLVESYEVDWIHSKKALGTSWEHAHARELNIGGKEPGEIAVSVLAEIIAHDHDLSVEGIEGMHSAAMVSLPPNTTSR